jgi:hypothetical protein
MDNGLPVADGPEEDARRAGVYEQAGRLLRRVALTYLRERHPKAFYDLLLSVIDCTERAITEGRRVDFRIVRPRRADSFWGAVGNAQVLGAYEELKRNLAPVWRSAAPSSKDLVILGHFVSNKGRYGVSQKTAEARRRAVIETRTGAVFEKLLEFVDAEVLRHRPLTRGHVAEWVRKEKTMTAVLLRVFGHLLAKEPRTIKAMLNTARKQARHDREYQARLEQKGFRTLGT